MSEKNVLSDTALAEANSPVATFAQCSPYFSSLENISQKRLTPCHPLSNTLLSRELEQVLNSE
jgi:hypothetical protein